MGAPFIAGWFFDPEFGVQSETDLDKQSDYLGWERRKLVLEMRRLQRERMYKRAPGPDTWHRIR